MNPGLSLVLFIVRIGITIYCINRAGTLNRSKGGWGCFGFFLPLLAFIWISLMKPKRVWENNTENSANSSIDQIYKDDVG